MLLKFILFIAAAIPVILFVRSVFFRRPTRLGEQFKKVKREIDVAINILIVVIAIVCAIAVGKLIWAWWTAI